MSINDCRIISLPKIPDDRGNLSFIESGRPIPFIIKRVYWIYDVPGGELRGGHAYKTLQEFFVALSGSFDVAIDDGNEKKIISLNRSYMGLYVPKMIWRHLENFSTNAVCMILASDIYKESDYLRDYRFFQNQISENADNADVHKISTSKL
jgi:dTDP-4-dehydrorhamnose 3,5-epimerase-like enzyme